MMDLRSFDRFFSARESQTQTNIPALDYLRLFAMGMVALQHAMAVHGKYAQTTWLNVNLGQSGVAIFCALSGYLSFRKAVPAPWVWFGAKLKQIFPAYWIVTLGSFALVIFFGTKEASWPLFVSQMLGMGYFTHGWKLVNVVSWFISLILLCYLLAAVAWASGQPRWVLAIISGVCIGLLVQSVEVDLSRHVLAFALAGWIAITRARTGVIVVIAGIGLYSAGMLDMQLAYASIALALLAAGLCIPMQERPYVKAASARTYEFFLVHGVFLVAFAQLLPISPVANVTLALIAAVVAALLLRVTVVRLTCLFAARFPRARAEPY